MARQWHKTLFCLSATRAILGVVFIVIFDRDSFASGWVCLSIIALSQLTDHLDGFIARRFSQPSLSGYLQDSIADKLFQIAVLLAVCRELELSYLLVWLVIARDLILLAGRVLDRGDQYKLKAYKIYSILFALVLRGGLVVAVCSVLWLEYQALLLTLATILLYASLIPAVIGQILLFKHHANPAV